MDLSLENSSSKNADLLSPTKSTRSALNVSRFLSRKPASEQKGLASWSTNTTYETHLAVDKYNSPEKENCLYLQTNSQLLAS